MKTPENRELTYEGYVRIGQDWSSGRNFFGKSHKTSGTIEDPFRMESEVIWAICNQLDIRSNDIFDQTCSLIGDLRGSSKYTPGHPISKKVVKLKFRILIEEVELIDDKEKEKE